MKVKIRTIDNFNIIRDDNKMVFYADVAEEEIESLIQRDFPEADITSISQIKLGHFYNKNHP